jgi:hypothetical protein
MSRNQIQKLLIQAIEDDNIEAAEYWQDALDRMDEDNSEIWLS